MGGGQDRRQAWVTRISTGGRSRTGRFLGNRPLIDWQTPPAQICDASNPPFVRWFAGGKTNLCHNAVDRHLAGADLPALIYVSSETNEERVYTFRELHHEVQRMAAVLQSLGWARVTAS